MARTLARRCCCCCAALAMRTTLALAPSSPAALSRVRVELFPGTNGDGDELRRRTAFLRDKGVAAFNVVNKSRGDDALRSADAIAGAFPAGKSRGAPSVCAHYSLKYNKSRKADGAFLLLKEVVSASPQSAATELLLVTGSGPKGRLDSLSALERLAREGLTALPAAVALAVAFNPFFPASDDNEEETARLRRKLATGLVAKVYLQFGTDLERLRGALRLLAELQQSASPRRFEVCGSIFLPTKKLRAQQRFRPWNGVFLSDEFLSSDDGARGIVVQMMRLYQEHGCEILIEAPGVRNDNDWAVVESLLAERDAATPPALIGNELGGARHEAKEAEMPHRAEEESAVTKRRKISTPAPESGATGVPPAAVPSGRLGQPAVVLFHSHDVRAHDNVALQLASHHARVVPAFLWSRKEQGEWGVTGCLEVILKDALRHLSAQLARHGLTLTCREGEDSAAALGQLCDECGAGAVYWNTEHTPEGRRRETRYEAALAGRGVACVASQSSLLHDPAQLELSAGFRGGHWGTLMPFLKACRAQLGAPRVPPRRSDTFCLLEGMRGPDAPPSSTAVDALDMAVVRGRDDWPARILETFQMSEEGALRDMNGFFEGTSGLAKYERERSRADIEGSTSRLSAHLRIGTLSPNELYYKTEASGLDYDDRKTFSRRLIWRDLAYFHLLTFPEMRDMSIRRHYEDTEWCSGEEEERRFEAWKLGRTGFPLVDAGMRELYATGWMTQSVRMVVASFLVEYLRVNWVKGCSWFHYVLADADSAINPMMWQNAGRSGIDQWNFVMSPTAASQDATGKYTRKWVPELSELPSSVLHKPWEAPAQVLQTAGVVLGESYPVRIVEDLKAARAASVDAVLEMRRRNQQFNTDRGYDLITLPHGERTVVFTKKEFRIDKKGELMKESSKKSKRNYGGGRGRKGRAAHKKLLRQKAAGKV